MAPSRSDARSRSTRPVRQSRTKVQTYHEETTSEDETTRQHGSADENPRRASVSLRPRNTTAVRPSYREESTDASSTEISDESDVDTGQATPVGPQSTVLYPASELLTTPAPPSTTRTSQRTRRQPPSRPKQTRSQKNKRSQKRGRDLGRPLNKRAKLDTSEAIFVGSGVIPPWQTLPYQVLLEIFWHASFPLVDEKQPGNQAPIKWLLNVALLCRSFHEPALAALYYSPPLASGYKSHGLLRLVSMPPSSLSMNYAGKIRELHVDAEQILGYKSGPTLGYFDLGQLIQKTPRVHTLRLYHHEDFIVGMPPWNLGLSKWNYPPSLFSAIAESELLLRSWDWNGRFLETLDLLPLMLEKHLLPAFQRIKKLRLVHLFDPDRENTSTREAAIASATREAAFATALKALPELEDLEFIECTLVSASLLPQLPLTIRSLTLCNCDRIFSPHISEFLKTHGAQLRQLNLSHNRHLNMCFITTLARDCPRLEKFKMDISIHDWSSYHDTDPHFSDLLFHTEVPTWPRTLREIELIQLRHWDADVAETFFKSLIDAAPNLPYLRRLEISAILEIGWRARANFRERWIGRFEKVFLRQSPPPNPDLRSLRKRPLRQEQLPIHVDDPAHANTTCNGPSAPSTRQSSRLSHRKVSEASESTNFQSVTSPSEIEDMDVQGMCDIVAIRIDNQRPTETQFNENDFLDDELSGDEEWDGEDYEPGDVHAW
ncbi:uncharacterized protein N7459_004489 [Penicillium hispanicum]|uniref:uncharacterized protein n=1 Tax=Penicillium hispanicum TaxID=1080232 RepID=UPI002541160F|nr:uncharacterized protein N7459_004489 [Penicillium hispanicum]KAJ5584689.1 hypothetical protein N7459_004489 [Penicillium hispanicum]